MFYLRQKTLPSLLLSGILLLGGHEILSAQSLDRQVIGTSGRQYVTAGARVVFTIGEPLTSTLTADEGVITQGFHQGTITVTSVAGMRNPLSVKVYPNPVTQSLTVENPTDGTAWRLHALDGHLLGSGTLIKGANLLNLSMLRQAVYTLSISSPDGERNAYRIVKMP